MLSLHFKITGGERVQQKLKRGETIADALPKGMKKAQFYIQSTIPAYPAPPEGSTYRRTGTLGRSLTAAKGQAVGALSRVEHLGNHTTGYIGTNIVYAPYVVGPPEGPKGTRQAWMHKGRWYHLKDVVIKARPKVIQILRKAVLEYLGE